MPTTHPKSQASRTSPADAASGPARSPRTRPPGPSSPSSSATRGRPADAASPSPDFAREAVIRLHAYALWERRGRSDGHAMDDWLQAEAELSRLAGRSRPRLPGPGTEGTH